MLVREKLEQITGVKLEHPEREEWGDYAAFMKPGEETDRVIEKLKKLDFAEKVSRVGGFINIKLKDQYFITLLDQVTIKPNEQKKRILVEYSSPNIAKSFGIGHMRSTIIGQALYNIYKYLGNEVVGDNHLGDWGTQFGKLLYMIDRERLGLKIKSLTVEDLERLYVQYHKLSEDNKKIDKEAKKWFKRLEDGDIIVRKLWNNCVQTSLREFERIYKLLDIIIDNSFGESFYEAMMPAVINEAKEKGIVKESQGALVIETGHDSPLMLLKSDGATTYATRDLATLKFRKEKWDLDMIVYEVGAEQTLHFQQVFAAAQLMGYVRKGCNLIHTKHGLYLGSDGKKFKTRTGSTVNLEKVLQEAIELAKKFNLDTEIARAVGIGAIKYFDLSHNVQSDIVFDWEKVMALEGNSGPYIQYTYARTQSVLRKAKRTRSLLVRPDDHPRKDLYNSEELAVLRWIYRWPEIVEEAGERLAPNLICSFIYELAQRFNSFYSKHSILNPNNSPSAMAGPSLNLREGNERGELRDFRLALTAAVGQVLKMGLEMLGIKALEKM